jgi:hypothetical protein
VEGIETVAAHDNPFSASPKHNSAFDGDDMPTDDVDTAEDPEIAAIFDEHASSAPLQEMLDLDFQSLSALDPTQMHDFAQVEFDPSESTVWPSHDWHDLDLPLSIQFLFEDEGSLTFVGPSPGESERVVSGNGEFVRMHVCSDGKFRQQSVEYR